MLKEKTGVNMDKEQDKLSLFANERYEDLAAIAGATLIMLLVWV